MERNAEGKLTRLVLLLLLLRARDGADAAEIACRQWLAACSSSTPLEPRESSDRQRTVGR